MFPLQDRSQSSRSSSSSDILAPLEIDGMDDYRIYKSYNSRWYLSALICSRSSILWISYIAQSKAFHRMRRALPTDASQPSSSNSSYPLFQWLVHLFKLAFIESDSLGHQSVLLILHQFPSRFVFIYFILCILEELFELWCSPLVVFNELVALYDQRNKSIAWDPQQDNGK